MFKSDYVGESKMTTTIGTVELEQSKSVDFSLIILNSILFCSAKREKFTIQLDRALN